MIEGANIFELLQDYANDVWPVSNLYEVGQLIYILRSNGDFEMAEHLEIWKESMETRVYTEHNDGLGVS